MVWDAAASNALAVPAIGVECARERLKENTERVRRSTSNPKA